MFAQDLQNRSPALVRQRVQYRIHSPNVTGRVRTRKVTYDITDVRGPTVRAAQAFSGVLNR